MGGGTTADSGINNEKNMCVCVCVGTLCQLQKDKTNKQTNE